MTKFPTIVVGNCLLYLAVLDGMFSNPTGARTVQSSLVFVLDGSGSMWGRYRLDWHEAQHETQRMTLADEIVIPDHTLVEVEDAMWPIHRQSGKKLAEFAPRYL